MDEPQEQTRERSTRDYNNPSYRTEPATQFDLSSLEPLKHIWVDRGLKLSCEGANHPNHFVMKR